MSVKSALPLAGLAVVLLGAAPALSQNATVTRIEPRPFYGATVTIEEGVRVFRPLPRHKSIIINPGHKTPLRVHVDNTDADRAPPLVNNVTVNTRFIRRRPRVTIPWNRRY